MTRLVANATAAVAHPEAVIAEVCEHFSDHEARIDRDGSAYVVTFPFGTGRLDAQGGTIVIQAEADDITGLYYMRMAIAGHVKELAGPSTPNIVWTGDGQDIRTPPNFRMVRVLRVEDLTGSLRRVTFAGEDIARFATDDALHVGLLIPPPGSLLLPPTVGADGLLVWPEGTDRPAIRRYTIRSCDASAGTLDVDFVLHADAGPGSAFAARAREGDVIGVAGPMGGSIRPDKDWYLLAGDETALPAIARILEFLPAEKRGIALIEVDDARSEIELRNNTAIEVTWVHRRGGDHETASPLAEAVRRIRFPDDLSAAYAWVGCEFADFKAIRSFLRSEVRLPKDQHLVVAYWRKGQADDPTSSAAHDE